MRWSGTYPSQRHCLRQWDNLDQFIYRRPAGRFSFSWSALWRRVGRKEWWTAQFVKGTRIDAITWLLVFVTKRVYAPRHMYLFGSWLLPLAPIVQSCHFWRVTAGVVMTLNVDLSDDKWSQASLPARWGGLEIRSVVLLAPSAYFASVACTCQFRLEMDNSTVRILQLVCV